MTSRSRSKSAIRRGGKLYVWDLSTDSYVAVREAGPEAGPTVPFDTLDHDQLPPTVAADVYPDRPPGRRPRQGG